MQLNDDIIVSQNDFFLSWDKRGSGGSMRGTESKHKNDHLGHTHKNIKSLVTCYKSILTPEPEGCVQTLERKGQES